jgi:hypothetical protein
VAKPLHRYNRTDVVDLLKQHRFSVTRAAKAVNAPAETVWRLIYKFNLEVDLRAGQRVLNANAGLCAAAAKEVSGANHG